MKLSEITKMIRSISPVETDFSTEKTQDLIAQLGLEFGNFYQELEMDSPYVDTHQDISTSNAHLQFHSHTFYEMLCCRNTCGAEYLIGTERYKLQKGDVIFVPPGISHRPLLPDHLKEPYTRDVIWFSEEFLQMLKESAGGIFNHFAQPFLFRTAGTRWEFICDLFRSNVREAEEGHPGWAALVHSNTITIMVQLFRAALDLKSIPMKAEKPELLDRVLAYVEEHLSEKITLAETAHHFYISESTITQTFRKKMGISFYRCVTQRRLIASKALIEKGLALEIVAEQVGFSDYSAFFRAFKQEYGISPRQYRKMQNG